MKIKKTIYKSPAVTVTTTNTIGRIASHFPSRCQVHRSDSTNHKKPPHRCALINPKHSTARRPISLAGPTLSLTLCWFGACVSPTVCSHAVDATATATRDTTHRSSIDTHPHSTKIHRTARVPAVDVNKKSHAHTRSAADSQLIKHRPSPPVWRDASVRHKFRFGHRTTGAWRCACKHRPAHLST